MKHCHDVGMTAGYHRLWAHRSYNATRTLEYILALLAAAAAVEGSIMLWATRHRAHHRYTDTELDPKNASKGFLWAHFGWILIKPRREPGKVDVGDLMKNDIVIWQQRYYSWLVLTMAVALPTLVAGIGWGDWKGGLVYATFLRVVMLNHVSHPLHLTYVIDGNRARLIPVSILWHIGSVKLRLTISIPHETISSLHFLPSVKAIIISIISSQWIIALVIGGTSSTPQNGSFGCVRKSVWQVT